MSLADQCPSESGCYIVRNDGLVLYVGQSADIKGRWKGHQYRSFFDVNFPNATIEFVLCDKKDLLQKEAELIKELHPIMNNTPKSKYRRILGIEDDWWIKALPPERRRIVKKALRIK